MISTLAGTGVRGYSGDGGQSTAAQVSVPKAVGVTPAGDILVAEEQNNRIRFIGTVVAPANTSLPTVSGTAVQGGSLTATAGGWSGTGPVISYAWERCSPGCAAIAGATGKTYVPTGADVGSKLRVSVMGSNSSGFASASSAQTATIPAAVLPPTNIGAPTISGTAAQGNTLTVADGAWSGATPMSFAYQWSRCNASGSSCANIAGATAKTYTLGAADVGSTLRARVDASNAAGSSDYAARVAASGALSYWRLGDAGGTAVDERGFANGSYLGGSSQAASLLARDGNPAVSLDGTSQYADVPSNAAWTGSTFSIELLVKPSPGPINNKTIWSTMGPDFAGWWLNTSSTGVPRMFIGDGSAWRYDASAPPLVAGTAYHLVATYDGSRARLYVNGALVSTGPVVAMAPDVAGSVMRFGAYSTGPGQYWPGVLDDASFYPSVLSAADVAAHYDASAYGSSALSGASGVVGGTAPANTALPVISGTAQQGQSLSSTTGTWTGTAPITYTRQWRRCDAGGASCANIAGATGASYTLVAADVGATVRVRVTATNSAGSGSADSNASLVVVAPPAAPANTSLPVVSGSAVSGQVLATSDGTWTGTAPITFTRQWRRCDAGGASCVNISGATAASYTLVAADVGSTIRARITATNASGSATADSAATAVVTSAPSPPVSTGLPVVSGSAQSGQSLSVSSGSWSGSTPMSFGYQWRRCDASGGACVDVGGATSSSYAVVAGDVGSTLRAVVTASNGGGSASATSAQTAVVVAGSSSGSMTFSVAAGGDDGDVTVSGASYPPSGSPGVNAAGGYFTAGRRFAFGSYYVNVPSLRFDTSALPDGATITSATLKVYVIKKVDGDSRNLMAEWYPGSSWPIDASDYSLNSSGSALAGSGVPSLTVGAVNSFALSGVSSVSTTGWTALRLHLSGGQPAGDNYVQMAAFENANPEAQLVVTYSEGPPSPPVSTGLPVVSGSAQSGQSLSVSSGSWSGSTPMSFGYQWRRCDASGGACVDVGGATSSSYAVVAGDVGSTLRAVVTASNGGGSASATSAQTAVVVAGSSSMTFSVVAAGDDGDLTVAGPAASGYPPGTAPAVNTSGTALTAGRRLAFGEYEVIVPLMRFDTSGLPDGATITSATLKVYVTKKTDADDRSLTAEWVDGSSTWPIDAGDFTLVGSGSALAGSDITGLNVGAVNSFGLSGLSSVSTTGWTGLRLHVSGGQPTGDNYVQMAAFGNANPAAQLVVTYTTG